MSGDVLTKFIEQFGFEHIKPSFVLKLSSDIYTFNRITIPTMSFLRLKCWIFILKAKTPLVYQTPYNLQI